MLPPKSVPDKSLQSKEATMEPTPRQQQLLELDPATTPRLKQTQPYQRQHIIVTHTELA